MGRKRIYFETQETKITTKKGWFDMDEDYTQLYSCFSEIAPKIHSSTSFKLLVWFLAYKTNNYNGLDTGMHSFEQFNDYLGRTCGHNCRITYRTYTNCMKELKEAGAITQLGKGHYFANPNMFWKKGMNKREEQLIEEYKDGSMISLNPAAPPDEIEIKRLTTKNIPNDPTI